MSSPPIQRGCGPMTVGHARQRLRELKATWAYAFAMGHGCSIGPDPRFEVVRREVAELNAIIAEHSPAETDS